MFRELLPLVKQRLVMLSIRHLEDDRLQVSVIPKVLKEGENAALTTPLSVTATAEELDAELPQAIVGFVAGHLSLQMALDHAKAEMDAAARKAKEEARAKSKTTPSRPAVEQAKPAAPPAATAAAPPPGLFDAASSSPAQTAAAETSDEPEEEDSEAEPTAA